MRSLLLSIIFKLMQVVVFSWFFLVRSHKNRLHYKMHIIITVCIHFYSIVYSISFLSFLNKHFFVSLICAEPLSICLFLYWNALEFSVYSNGFIFFRISSMHLKCITIDNLLFTNFFLHCRYSASDQFSFTFFKTIKISNLNKE